MSGAALQLSDLAPGLLIGDGVSIGEGRCSSRCLRRAGEFAAYLGVRHCIGVANGTEALTIALALSEAQVAEVCAAVLSGS